MEDQRLPEGATLDPSEADRIITSSDGNRVRAALAYWKERCAELGESVFDDLTISQTPAMQFVQAVPHGQIADLIPNRSGLTYDGHIPLDSDDRQNLVSGAGCLMSMDELAAFLNDKSTAADKLGGSRADAGSISTYLDAFVRAADVPPATPTDADSASRGLRAARELFDMARRFYYAADSVSAVGLSISECLALHRAEGAFATTPPPDSYAHGPLISTAPKGCRVDQVALGKLTKKVERPGFVLAIPMKEYKDVLKDPEMTWSGRSVQFEAAMTNLLVTGGLDQIVSWSPQQPSNGDFPKIDDVRVLIGQVDLHGMLTALDLADHDLTIRQLLRMSFLLLANILMANIEVADRLDRADVMLNAALKEVRTLIDFHKVQVTQSPKPDDAHLVGDVSGAETHQVLRIQCKWYASRRRVHTLAALQDREEKFKKMEPFSPFISYLRFHVGDPIFLGIILRYLDQIDALHDVAKKDRSGWGGVFSDAIRNSNLPLGQSERNAMRAGVSHWRSNVAAAGANNTLETSWRHIGLIDLLNAMPSSSKLRMPSVPTDTFATSFFKNLATTRAVAKQLVARIEKFNLVGVINAGLEVIPMDFLVPKHVGKGVHSIMPMPNRQLGEIPAQFKHVWPETTRRLAFIRFKAREPLVKAHNFERLRLVYEQAWDVAGKSKG